MAAAGQVGERLRTEHGIKPQLLAWSAVLGGLNQAELEQGLAESVVAITDLDAVFAPGTCLTDRVSSVSCDPRYFGTDADQDAGWRASRDTLPLSAIPTPGFGDQRSVR